MRPVARSARRHKACSAHAVDRRSNLVRRKDRIFYHLLLLVDHLPVLGAGGRSPSGERLSGKPKQRLAAPVHCVHHAKDLTLSIRLLNSLMEPRLRTESIHPHLKLSKACSRLNISFGVLVVCHCYRKAATSFESSRLGKLTATQSSNIAVAWIIADRGNDLPSALNLEICNRRGSNPVTEAN